jgi:hypothetical protein
MPYKTRETMLWLHLYLLKQSYPTDRAPWIVILNGAKDLSVLKKNN